MTDDFADNLARVRERIAAAAMRAGRRPEEITLIAVTKRQSADAVQTAAANGLTEFGENYVQEAEDKRAAVTAPSRWHLIGHLQTNKARRAAELFDVVQSVDSVKIAQALGRHALALGKTLEVLVQVHLGEEATKTGALPDLTLDLAEETAAIPGLAPRGLMGVAPLDDDPRPYFRQLRALFDRLPDERRHILSMGMSGDFETAIEEGATMLRLGTTLFGSRLP